LANRCRPANGSFAIGAAWSAITRKTSGVSFLFKLTQVRAPSRRITRFQLDFTEGKAALN
jgi:hypothetical protein